MTMFKWFRISLVSLNHKVLGTGLNSMHVCSMIDQVRTRMLLITCWGLCVPQMQALDYSNILGSKERLHLSGWKLHM